MFLSILLLLALGAFIPLSDVLFGLASTAVASGKLIRGVSDRKPHGSRPIHSTA